MPATFVGHGEGEGRLKAGMMGNLHGERIPSFPTPHSPNVQETLPLPPQQETRNAFWMVPIWAFSHIDEREMRCLVRSLRIV